MNRQEIRKAGFLAGIQVDYFNPYSNYEDSEGSPE